MFFQVRYLKIIEKSGYQALPWVRYITQNGDYQLRTQQIKNLYIPENYIINNEERSNQTFNPCIDTETVGKHKFIVAQIHKTPLILFVELNHSKQMSQCCVNFIGIQQKILIKLCATGPRLFFVEHYFLKLVDKILLANTQNNLFGRL